MFNQQQHHQGNAPGSYQYLFNDFSNQQGTNNKAESQFTVTHQQDFPYQLQQSILGDKLAIGSENIKIYVPENYVRITYHPLFQMLIPLFPFQGIQSRSDDSESENVYTNHKRQYTEITRTPAPVREEEGEADVEYEDQ